MARSSTDLGQTSRPSGTRKRSKPLAIFKQLTRPAADQIAQERTTIPLNFGWQFCRSDETHDGQPGPIDGQPWESVNLPHSARLEPVNASGGRNFQGICWYRTALALSDAWKDRRIYLHFEGAMQIAEIWLNRRKIATNYCGYIPFTIDITPHVRFSAEPNELSVRLDNRDNPQVPPGKPQRLLDFTYFGGLYRNVKLIVTDRLHIVDPLLATRPAGGGVFVTFPSANPDFATVELRTNVRNEHRDPRDCTIVQELLDKDGSIVATAHSSNPVPSGVEATFHQSLRISRPNLWHPDHPHLYTLRTVVLDGDRPVDDQLTRIGIRRICFEREKDLFINGEHFISIGCNRHQDHPYVGYALSDNAHWRDVKKLREAGFTSVRSHYPQAPAFMDACDELGMLAIVSNPGWQFVGDQVFQDRAVENARLMVRRDRNRPSVVLWEAALNESENGVLQSRLHKAVHEEYPGDQCFTAGDREEGLEKHGAERWDVEYLHNDGTKPYWIREWGDHVDNWSDQQSRSRVPRAWGETPMLIQAASHLRRLNEILSDPSGRLCGACLWAAVDCQRGYHHQPFFGGVLDLFRLPKFNYYLFQSQRSPRIHINGLDDGPMVFIANFATFLSPTSVTIFSNCEEVILLVDDKVIGRKKPDPGHSVPHPPFTFQVECFAHEQSTMYMTGVAKIEKPPVEVKAQGLINGQVIATHVVRPPGVAARLELEPDICGRPLAADGSDWLRIHAKVCDARGVVCPFADDLIEFSVEGGGRIVGSADIGANPVRAEAGIATAIVQSSDRRPGKIVVKATGFGLKPGSVEIISA